MKTILVTGSTDGIGKATASALAEQGCGVIVHGRNDAKARSAQQNLFDVTGNPNIQGRFSRFLLAGSGKGNGLTPQRPAET